MHNYCFCLFFSNLLGSLLCTFLSANNLFLRQVNQPCEDPETSKVVNVTGDTCSSSISEPSNKSVCSDNDNTNSIERKPRSPMKRRTSSSRYIKWSFYCSNKSDFYQLLL